MKTVSPPLPHQQQPTLEKAALHTRRRADRGDTSVRTVRHLYWSSTFRLVWPASFGTREHARNMLPSPPPILCLPRTRSFRGLGHPSRHDLAKSQYSRMKLRPKWSGLCQMNHRTLRFEVMRAYYYVLCREECCAYCARPGWPCSFPHSLSQCCWLPLGLPRALPPVDQSHESTTPKGPNRRHS